MTVTRTSLSLVTLLMLAGIPQFLQAEQPLDVSFREIAVSDDVGPAVSAASATLSVDSESAVDDGPTVAPECYCQMCPRIYVQAEELILGRVNSLRYQPLVVTGVAPASPTTVLSTDDLDFHAEVAPRLLIGWLSGPDDAFELSYFGMHNWHDMIEATQDNALRLPGDLGLNTYDFLDTDTLRVSYYSELHNAEANAVLGFRRWSFLTGFRYLNLDEHCILQAIDSDTETSNYRVHSWNNLIGFQVGARIERQRGRFGWEFTGKTGVFGNAAGQSTFIGDRNNTLTVRNLNRNEGAAAFIGDMNLTAIWRLSRVWSLRAGYNVMWIEGLALAPDQLDFTDTATSSTAVDTDGGVFLHGANLGLEARW